MCWKTCVSTCACLTARQAGKGTAMHSWSRMLPWARCSDTALQEFHRASRASFYIYSDEAKLLLGTATRSRACRGTCLHLLLHAFLLHSRPSSRTPSQTRPSLGRGLQVRIRVCRPPPQSLVQSPQADHGFQPPGQNPEKPRELRWEPSTQEAKATLAWQTLQYIYCQAPKLGCRWMW